MIRIRTLERTILKYRYLNFHAKNMGILIKFDEKKKIQIQVPGVPTSFRQFSKKSLNVTKSEKTRESLFTF